MSTKQDLIRQFNDYSVEQLEKLHIIAQSILNPMLNQLVSVDFASMLDLVFKSGGLADTYFPTWTDRGRADFGRFLVELFALFSDKDFFYINHFSREAHGSTAELYRSLLHKALSNGVTVTTNAGAEATFEIVFENGAEYTYPRGSIQIGIDGVDGFVFSNKEEFVLPANYTTPEPTTLVDFIHGELQSLSGNFNGKSIIIDKENIVNQSIKLTVASVVYTEVDSFADGNSSTKHFMVFYNEKGQAEIVFAHNDYGYTPNVNDVWEVELFIGGGYNGNLSAGTLDKVITCPDRQILNFTQPETTGGTDLLTKEELRARVINYQKHQDRCVQLEDTKEIARELDFVHNVFAMTVSNYVFVFAVTPTGLMSSLQEDALYDHLLPAKWLMNYGLMVANPPLQVITLELDIYVLSSTSQSAAQQEADEVVQDYLDYTRNADFGEGVKRGKLSNLILQKVTGSQNVVFTTLHKELIGSGVEDIEVLAQQMIDYSGSSITVNIVGGQ